MWTFDQRQTGSMPTEAAPWGLSNGDFADAQAWLDRLKESGT